jgi:hypothetical protein
MSILLSVPLGNGSSLAASTISTYDLRAKASDMLGTLMKTYGPDYETLIPRKPIHQAPRPTLILVTSRRDTNPSKSTRLPRVVQIDNPNRHPRHPSSRLLARSVPRSASRAIKDQQSGILAKFVGWGCARVAHVGRAIGEGVASGEGVDCEVDVGESLLTICVG